MSRTACLRYASPFCSGQTKRKNYNIRNGMNRGERSLRKFKTHMRYVIANGYGVKLSRSTSSEDREMLTSELSLVDLHSMRYTFITALISKGVDPKTVQYLAGHTDVKTTLGIYAQCKAESPIEAMQKLDW